MDSLTICLILFSVMMIILGMPDTFEKGDDNED